MLRRTLLISRSIRSPETYKFTQKVSMVKGWYCTSTHQDTSYFKQKISDFNKNKNSTEILNVFEKMNEDDIELDLEDIHDTLVLISKKKEKDNITKLLSIIDNSNIVPNTQTMNLAIHAFIQCESPQLAIDILDVMEKNNIPADLDTYGSIITCCIQSKKLEEAIKFMDEMVQCGLEPTLPMFNLLLLSLTQLDKHDKVVSLIENIDNYNVSPDIFTANSMLRSLSVLGYNDRVITVFDNMKKNNITPNAESFLIVVDCLCATEQFNGATELIDEMKDINDVKPNIALFNRVLTGLVSKEYYERAAEFYEKLDDYSMKPDKSTIKTMIMVYNNIGKSSKAIALLDELIEMKAKIEPAILNYLLAYNVARGNFDDAQYVIDQIDEFNLNGDHITIQLRDKLKILLDKQSK